MLVEKTKAQYKQSEQNLERTLRSIWQSLYTARDKLNGLANAKSYYLQYSALPGGAFPWAYAGSTELSAFVQDKFKVTNDFTLTYGVRLDETIYKQAMTDNPYFDALVFNGKSYNIGKAPMNNLLVSPRLGFNWNPKGDKTLQVRGGTGIFAGPPPFVWVSNQASNNGIQFGSFTVANKAFNRRLYLANAIRAGTQRNLLASRRAITRCQACLYDRNVFLGVHRSCGVPNCVPDRLCCPPPY